MDLTQKNGDYEVDASFMGTEVASSKATGLTYCNVEWKRTGLYKHSTYSKMAERASCLVWKRTRSVHYAGQGGKEGFHDRVIITLPSATHAHIETHFV